MARDASILSQRVHFFVRLRFDVHHGLVHVQQFRQVLLNLLFVRRDLRSLRDQSAIDVPQLVSGFFHQSNGFVNEHVRRLALPFRIIVREKLANIGQTERTGDGIYNAVQQNVTVRVRDASSIVRHFDAS